MQMNHEVDLSNMNLHTDLAIDTIAKNNIKAVVRKNKNIKVTEINLDKESSKLIKKKVGKYITIEFDDITDISNKNRVLNIFSKELSKVINKTKDSYFLVIGLGNIKSTPDSLGAKVVDNIIVTNHMYELDVLDSNFSRVSAIAPGVYAKTGIKTFDIISSIVKKVKPTQIIIIDSLASNSLERLNKTIQITDTGIEPGSGMGNKNNEISKKTLGVDCISIGIPTVIDINKINKKETNFIVTPNEIDFIMDILVNIIASGINKAIHGL